MLQIEIHLKGRINQQWAGWFDSLTSSFSGQDETVLTGIVADQAALYGIISHLRDLGLQLILVSSKEMKENSNGYNQ
jgi:predicted mannosyl-3-phosphoglycerate phosphatase (HAD superfamily)